MPSFTEPSSDYVQWQTARRQQAAQAAREAAIDIIEQYNRIVFPDESAGNDNGNQFTRYNSHVTVALNNSIIDAAAAKDLGDLKGKGKTRSPRNKKSTFGGDNGLRPGGGAGVFTEGISSLSRRSHHPLALQRNDVVRENLPETVKVAREKSRLYFSLNQSTSGAQNKPTANKGDLSAKSTKTLPPPQIAYPWGDMLGLPEMRRSKTFHHDGPTSDRSGLATRSTLDSRGSVVTDIQPIRSHRRPPGWRYLRYPSTTGAPPSTPMTADYFVPSNTPQMFRGERSFLRPSKPPSISIVSFGGDTVGEGVKSQDFRSKLPAAFKGVPQDPGKGTVGTMTNGIPRTSTSSSRPGIDLPQLPIRATDAKDASFALTPHERLSRMNYSSQAAGRRTRRRLPGSGFTMQKPVKILSSDPDQDDTATTDKDTTAATVASSDPYADRFKQGSNVSAVCEVYIPIPPPASATNESDNEEELLEPAIMLTVHEEEEGGEKEAEINPFSPTAPSAQLSGGRGGAKWEGGPGLNGTGANGAKENGEMSPRVPPSEKAGSQSNRSLLSVPNLNLDLHEARPPLLHQEEESVVLTLEIPQLNQSPEIPHTPPPPAGSQKSGTASLKSGDAPPSPISVNGELKSDSPPIASTSIVNTARTIATQTSVPYDPDAASNDRPKVVKVKTLSMFPDIAPPGSPTCTYGGVEGELSSMSVASSEIMLRYRSKTMNPGKSSTTLPDVHKDTKSQLDATGGGGGGGDEAGGDEERARVKSGVRNITFISPLETQQNAKRC